MKNYHGLAIIIAFWASIGLLVGCNITEPEVPDYKLTPLFTTSEGCTAYRFQDGGNNGKNLPYFVACKEDKTTEIIEILKEDAKLPTVKLPPRPTKKAVPK